MPTSVSNLQFCLTGGPYRMGDGSFKFMVVVFQPSLVAGAPADIVATADIHVRNDKVCSALAGAIHQVAAQLPPELTVTGR